METQITSNFIPLQQPYPVIKHLYKIGVQIGIQIVTVAFGTPFKIETHRYPVVAAEDDKNLSSIKDLTQLGGAAATPVVWDNVDVDNVLVLFKLNAELNWTDLIKLLWEDQAKYADPRQLLQTHMLMKLSSYCRSITLNAPGSCPIHLSLVTDADGQPLAVSSKHDDLFALYALWDDDPAAMEGSILNILQDYLLFFQQKWHIRWPCLLRYESTDERLSLLVEAYLKYLGRDAKISSYYEENFKILTDYGVSVEVSNALTELHGEYSIYVGQFERLENGERFVYEQRWEQEGDTKGKGVVTFRKSRYDDGKIVEEIAYQVDGDRFERVS